VGRIDIGRNFMLENLTELKNDMQAKKWTICSFIFSYKEIEYIVLVKRFVGKEVRKNKYALVKLLKLPTPKRCAEP
jgi:hypothetical protein